MAIPETMLAVRTHGPRDYRVEEVPVPTPGPGEVLIEVEACGICASDMKCFTGGELFWGKDNAGGYLEGPCVAGHEYAGRVAALGEGAAEKHGLAIGDRVIAEQIVPCGECRYCQRGEYWMCQVHNIFGFKHFTNGGMARYSLYPAKARIHKIPASLSAGETAYLEPAACAWHAVDRGEIKPGDTVVVSGVGNIGLCMLQIARMSDPGLVIALDAKQYRLDLAREFGADVTIDVTQEDAVAKVRELTEGYGCDVYIEASGNPAHRAGVGQRRQRAGEEVLLVGEGHQQVGQGRARRRPRLRLVAGDRQRHVDHADVDPHRLVQRPEARAPRRPQQRPETLGERLLGAVVVELRVVDVEQERQIHERPATRGRSGSSGRRRSARPPSLGRTG
jgi:threonine dehydrogenase-like Zn-dependent dehydrogenase